MAEEAKKKDNEQAPQTNSMAAFSAKMKDLEEALSLLYITKNPSGRLKFKEKWPEVADHLFGSELIKYDTEGVEDRKHRTKLEEEANDRRIDLKQTIAEIVDSSVKSGSLQFDYVGGVIDLYGPVISTYLYAEDVIERVRPGVLAAHKEKTAEPSADDAQEKKPAVGDDMSDTANISAVSDELNMEKDDMMETGTIDEDQDTVADDMQKEKEQAEDKKLSNEEKTILSNASEVPEEAEGTEALLPDNHVPDNVHQPETKPTLPSEPPKQESSPEVKPIETPVPPSEAKPPVETQAPPVLPDAEPQSVKPIETPPPVLPEVEKPAESVAQEAPANPAPPVSDVPDILKPPPAETQAPPMPEAPKKVEELTAPQAAKAEKGVYKTMFNGLAKAV